MPRSFPSSVPTEQDRRRTRRIRTLARVIRIGAQGYAGFGHCRDLSDGGMRLVAPRPVERGQLLEIELAPGWSFRAEVVWTKGNECGVAFLEPIDSMSLLGPPEAQDQASNGHESIAEGDGRAAGDDASAQADTFKAGLHVKLKLEHGMERTALVRWTKRRAVALVLLDGFSLDDP